MHRSHDQHALQAVGIHLRDYPVHGEVLCENRTHHELHMLFNDSLQLSIRRHLCSKFTMLVCDLKRLNTAGTSSSPVSRWASLMARQLWSEDGSFCTDFVRCPCPALPHVLACWGIAS
eukprot:gnl/TRDRNA2_/TRDRNA2_171757_c0_seq2.p1 gnl/TRDRNA2_/TRDRNA2_171757_c0~~gnl/TRDRNA2_/TRDRNA2_171757_c0_seq2.p1  ORF type:complete len:118 (+),score=5.91 gnl/TRDRNA2_/TRDRNA2_171757_c0_seq2:170-523(+)